MAFPDDEGSPAAAGQGAAVGAVAAGVAVDFVKPVFAALGGDAARAACVAVPEAAVDEDDFFESGEDEVGGAGEGNFGSTGSSSLILDFSDSGLPPGHGMPQRVLRHLFQKKFG